MVDLYAFEIEALEKAITWLKDLCEGQVEAYSEDIETEVRALLKSILAAKGLELLSKEEEK